MKVSSRQTRTMRALTNLLIVAGAAILLLPHPKSVDVIPVALFVGVAVLLVLQWSASEPR
jgi:uncharacterized membrane protein YhhN